MKNFVIPTTTTTKLFVPSIWGWLHEPKENYVRSGTWINFLHSFLSSNMPSLRPFAFISCHITSLHVFFGLPCALLTCPNLICFTHRTGASLGPKALKVLLMITCLDAKTVIFQPIQVSQPWFKVAVLAADSAGTQTDRSRAIRAKRYV